MTIEIEELDDDMPIYPQIVIQGKPPTTISNLHGMVNEAWRQIRDRISHGEAQRFADQYYKAEKNTSNQAERFASIYAVVTKWVDVL
jgi:hypothetical protein